MRAHKVPVGRMRIGRLEPPVDVMRLPGVASVSWGDIRSMVATEGCNMTSLAHYIAVVIVAVVLICFISSLDMP